MAFVNYRPVQPDTTANSTSKRSKLPIPKYYEQLSGPLQRRLNSENEDDTVIVEITELMSIRTEAGLTLVTIFFKTIPKHRQQCEQFQKTETTQVRSMYETQKRSPKCLKYEREEEETFTDD